MVCVGQGITHDADSGWHGHHCRMLHVFTVVRLVQQVEQLETEQILQAQTEGKQENAD